MELQWNEIYSNFKNEYLGVTMRKINPFYSIKVAYSADDRFDFQQQANLYVMAVRLWSLRFSNKDNLV